MNGPLVTVVVRAPIVSITEAIAAQARLPDVVRAALAQTLRDRELSAAWVPRVWDDDDRAFVGWGVAARATGSGAERFAEVRVQAEHIWGRMQRSLDLPFAPRLFGGFAFDAEVGEPPAPGSAGAAWTPFGAAGFILPRVVYSYSDAGAVLAAFVPEADVAVIRLELEALRRELESQSAAAPPVLLAGPHSSGTHAVPAERSGRSPNMAVDPSAPGGAAPGSGAPEDAGESAYRALVARGLQEIARGTFAKVVLCRARHVALPPGADATRAFTFLDARHTACARFLVAAGAARFVGATPERLVFVRGRRVLTEALAGSLPRRAGLGEGDARAELLASAKDRAEHAFVVAAIRASLAPVCEGLSVPDEPTVRSLPHVYHLATPITGTLALRSHALDLAARLHPTPALCGSPKAAARAFILASEAQPRGWYGGAVGWFDSEGDGGFGVAIRSALISGADAWIYAGAGIVLGSDPERELVETVAKERAMREALDAASAPPAGDVAPETLRRAPGPSPEAA